MNKKDFLTPVGLILGIGLILVACAMGEDGLKIFYDTTSIIIVIFGSFASLLITFDIDDIKKVKNAIVYSLDKNDISKIELIEKIKYLSKKSRKEGLLSIEEDINDIDDEFLRNGLTLVVDGVEEKNIKDILEIQITSFENETMTYAKIFKVWGSYAPAFGMIGTLIGLIQMLADLGSPDMIASGMGKALITTFYGSLLANTILNPIGFNIDQKSVNDVYIKEMMIDAILIIRRGESTNTLEDKLTSYLSKEEYIKYKKVMLQGDVDYAS